MGHAKPVVGVIQWIKNQKETADEKKEFPLKLRATFQVLKDNKVHWVQKYYPLDLRCTVKDYAAAKKKPLTDFQRKIKAAIVEAEGRADSILRSNTTISMEDFELLYNSGNSLQTVDGIGKIILEELKNSGQIGTHQNYKNAFQKFEAYSPGVRFIEINPAWIRKFCTTATGIGDTTKGIYLRVLKVAFNRAILMKVITPDCYPFGKGKYQIKSAQKRKIALTIEEKNKLVAIEDPTLRYALDMWMFSYYGCGMNMADIATLKFSHIQRDPKNGDAIFKRREKTIRHGNEELKIPINAVMQTVINRWGNKSLNPNDYVFPVLRDGLTPAQVKNKIKRFMTPINAGLKIVGEKLNLPFALRTYSARHTFASISLQTGTRMEVLSVLLGHATLEMTQVYTNGFDLSTHRAAVAQL